MRNVSKHLLGKENSLRNILNKYKSVFIAFSGGVDSTYLSKVAFEVLGENAIAVTAASETYTKEELEFAKKITAEWGMRHIVIETSELSIPNFKDNPRDRCYFCKHELFSKLKELAKELGANEVIEGSNVDDLKDYRPGSKAIKELGIKSPLLEAGLTKDEIRSLSKEMGLPTHNKPALACLSSRFPYGEEITVEKLKKVEAAEKYIKELYQQDYPFQVRVRYYGDTAKLELDPVVIRKAEQDHLKIKDKLVAIGFKKVIIDPRGYRTGSLNEVLS